MAVIQVYTKCIKTKYKSKVISQSTFIVLLLGIFSVIGPFIFAYKTRGLWIKHDTFYEQPDIRFKGEYLFVATTNNPNRPITCSTYGYYQNIASNFDTCSLIKVTEIDNNYDRKVDELSFDLTVVLPETVEIRSFSIIIPLDYKLHKLCPLQMQSAIVFQYYFLGAVLELSVYGNLQTSQYSPLICHSKLKNNFNNNSVIKEDDDIENYKFKNIIAEYMKRNLTTHLTNVYTHALFGNEEEFKVNFHIHYPEQKFYYQPGFWQIIKYAWIQYYAIYIVIAWIIKKFKNYIFTNRLVLFYEESSIKKNE